MQFAKGLKTMHSPSGYVVHFLVGVSENESSGSYSPPPKKINFLCVCAGVRWTRATGVPKSATKVHCSVPDCTKCVAADRKREKCECEVTFSATVHYTAARSLLR